MEPVSLVPFEFNVGAALNLQLHVIAPLRWNAPLLAMCRHVLETLHLDGSSFRFSTHPGA